MSDDRREAVREQIYSMLYDVKHSMWAAEPDRTTTKIMAIIDTECLAVLIRLKAALPQLPWPESVFTPMKNEDWPKLAELVKTNLGYPIDRISGDNMRHAWRIYDEDMKKAIDAEIERLGGDK